MAPPVVLVLFCFLVWNVCHSLGITCNDRRSLCNTAGGLRYERVQDRIPGGGCRGAAQKDFACHST